jgi:hypothetical protein
MILANVMRFGILNLQAPAHAVAVAALAIAAEYIGHQAIAHNRIPTYAKT